MLRLVSGFAFSPSRWTRSAYVLVPSARARSSFDLCCGHKHHPRQTASLMTQQQSWVGRLEQGQFLSGVGKVRLGRWQSLMARPFLAVDTALATRALGHSLVYVG